MNNSKDATLFGIATMAQQGFAHSHSTMADQLATRLMSENPKLTYRDAVIEASRRLKADAINAATRAIGREVK
jgi:hypothetical protein